MANIVIRKGLKRDCPIIMKLISEYREYNKKYEEPFVTVKDLEVDGFGKSLFFKTLVAETDTNKGKKIVGYALFYLTYSSFLGRCSHMRNLYVTDEFKQCGIGTALLKYLVKNSLELGCNRTDFSVAKWNYAGMKFGKKHGAVNLTEEENWNFFRTDKKNMIKFMENPMTKNIDFMSPMNGCKDTPNVVVRKAEKKDCPDILHYIKELSHHIKKSQGVKILVKDLEADGFGDERIYRSFVAETGTPDGKKIIGYVLYYFGYSSCIGRSTYMEDLFLAQNFRYKNLGLAMAKAVMQDGMENGCNELLFVGLPWNAPSLKFYTKLEAFNLTEKEGWHLYRLGSDAMKKLISE